MSEVVAITGTPGSYLGSCSLYRMPNGEIRAEMTDMAAWQIEARDTIPDRFTDFARWMRDGAVSLEEQGAAFHD